MSHGGSSPTTSSGIGVTAGFVFLGYFFGLSSTEDNHFVVIAMIDLIARSPGSSPPDAGGAAGETGPDAVIISIVLVGLSPDSPTSLPGKGLNPHEWRIAGDGM
jgi:hypothetical protein